MLKVPVDAHRTATGMRNVAVDKSEKAFSPSPRYEDFAIGPTRFHWQSQSTTGENSPTGQRYVHQSDNKARFLLRLCWLPRRPDEHHPDAPLAEVKIHGHARGRQDRRLA